MIFHLCFILQLLLNKTQLGLARSVNVIDLQGFPETLTQMMPLPNVVAGDTAITN